MESRGRIRLKKQGQVCGVREIREIPASWNICKTYDLQDLSPSFLVLQVPMRTKYSEALSAGEPPTQGDRDNKNLWELSRSESKASHLGSEMGTADTMCL